MMMPRISIVTPSYDQADFLERTILSVLSQGYPHLEYIIIDGGSKDGSVDIIRKYDARLAFWVSEPDRGQADAIRKGFERATGDVVGWLNSDDMYLPGALLRVAEGYRKNPQGALFYGDYIKVDEKDRCIAVRQKTSFDYRIVLHAYEIPIQPASFFDRRSYLAVGGIDTRFHYTMDHDLILRLARRGTVHHVGGYLSAFRLHSSSKTMTVGKGYRFPEEAEQVWVKNVGRAPYYGERFLLHWFHAMRLSVRMFKEGCLSCRLGGKGSPYRIGQTYAPSADNWSQMFP